MTPNNTALAKDEVARANQAWESLMRAHAVMMRQFSQDNLWQGLSLREYDVLYALAKSTSALRQSDLTDRVLLSQPAISRLVDRLVTRGLVEREQDPNDKRGTLLALTARGRELQRRIGRIHGKQVAGYLTRALSPQELATLTHLMNSLIEVVDDDN